MTDTAAALPDNAPHLLVVDDDERLRSLLKRFLCEQGFRISTADSARAARDCMASLDFDLLILDIMMPGETGLELTRSLRDEAGKDVPILLLTAMGESTDRITGLESGADDYLPKPFEPRELVLRVQSILKRLRSAPQQQSSETPLTTDEQDSDELRFGPFRFDRKRGQLWKLEDTEERFIHLTEAEAALLRTLAGNANEAVSRDALAEASLAANPNSDPQGEGTINARTVDVQITRLRRKIENDPRYPQYLQTLRGVGYTLIC
ncbi:response regulator transcription factor [Kiloniella sp. b19]|uniref:response regulator transcription factor n=1 Tax=Kiloniella sp. GXU_MW_B19 TaxID=3141326 RepID=UPI0031D8FE74